MNKTPLGRLKRIELRKAWDNEAHDFTPWLAREENLALLGETLEIDLELETQEKNVGPFRADILCKDVATQHWVLIENQIERTDHGHLGQLLTYAAGLKAVTIIWIASRFTDEHRAALDWLNEVTNEEINFFGLEIELYRIGDSPVAPRFNIISKPNLWTHTVSQAARGIEARELSDTRRMQLEYWTGLNEMLQKRNGPVKPTKAWPGNYINHSIGRSNFTLVTYANIGENRIGVYVSMTGPDSKAHFHLLARDRLTIEEQIGKALDWRERTTVAESQIVLHWRGCDLNQRSLWPEYQRWMVENLEKFKLVLGPRIRLLKAEEYIPKEAGESGVG